MQELDHLNGLLDRLTEEESGDVIELARIMKPFAEATGEFQRRLIEYVQILSARVEALERANSVGSSGIAANGRVGERNTDPL